jgi:predicted butyrate kinase (DUF1464 family)
LRKGTARKEVLKMMYSEFVEGTGCKENQHNYEVFKNLEVMYMNTEMSKAEIYEYGKKLVDNSKSPEEIAAENEIKNDIESLKHDLEWLRMQKVRYEEYVATTSEAYYKSLWKADLANIKKEIKSANSKILLLRTVLA